MEAIAKIEVQQSQSSHRISGVELSSIISTFQDEPREEILLTRDGILLQVSASTILRCCNIKNLISEFGSVKKMEYFISASGAGCLALLQRKLLSIYKSTETSFEVCHQEDVTHGCDITTFDFINIGTQQLCLQPMKRIYDLKAGGLILQVKKNEAVDSSKVTNVISECCQKLENSILQSTKDIEQLKNLLKSACCILSGPLQDACKESNLVQNFFGESIPDLWHRPTVELQVGSKMIRHGAKWAAVYRLVNLSNNDLENLSVLPELSSQSRISFSAHFSGPSFRLQPEKSLKFIILFDDNYARIKWKDPFCCLMLEFQDSGTKLHHRQRLDPIAFSETESQSEVENNFRDKIIALKKIFVRKSVAVRSLFTNVQLFLDICTEKLNFTFHSSGNVYLNPQDEKIFFCGKEQTTRSLNVDLFGSTQDVLKSFVQSIYFHLPDDMTVIPLKKLTLEPQTLEASERIILARQKLNDEMSSIYKCLQTSRRSHYNRVMDQVEGTKSVYQKKRREFQNKVSRLRVPLKPFLLARSEVNLKEIETDFLFQCC